MRGDIGLLSQD